MNKNMNYFYIDESGSILNNSKVFIHGCLVTDTPNLIRDTLEQLREEIVDDLYFDKVVENPDQFDFHAVEDHPDVRTAIYRKLITLNWRAYFIILKKDGTFYNEFSKKEEHEIFTHTLTKLIHDRVIKFKGDKNLFLFETIEISNKSFKTILEEYFEVLDKDHDCAFQILNKEDDINMSTIDYLNYILYQILTKEKKQERMELNFEIFAPKIALINLINNKTYLSNSDQTLSLENLKKSWQGVE